MCVIISWLTQNLVTVGCRLSDMVLWSISRLSHLLINNHSSIITVVWLESTDPHWIISSQVWLIHILKLLRLTHIWSIILPVCKALPSSGLAFPAATLDVGLLLLVEWYLLSIIAIEEVHTGIRTCLILEIYLIGRLLDEIASRWGHTPRCYLLIHLPLTLVMCDILWMAHLITLTWLSLIAMVRHTLSDVALILKALLIQARFGKPGAMTSSPWIISMRCLLCLVARSGHPTTLCLHFGGLNILRSVVHIDFPGVHIIVILNVDIVIYVIHMLLLMVVLALPTLAILWLMSLFSGPTSLLLIGYIRQASFLRCIRYLARLRWAEAHRVLIWILVASGLSIHLSIFSVILMQSSHTAGACVKLRLIVRWITMLLVAKAYHNISCIVHVATARVPVGPQRCLSVLTDVVLVILLGIPCTICIITVSTGSIREIVCMTLTHLALGLIAICRCHFLQALNLACHWITYFRKKWNMMANIQHKNEQVKEAIQKWMHMHTWVHIENVMIRC